jgi:hypothetical protein
MDLFGKCPRAHCRADLSVRVRKVDEARHATCADCGWPVLIFRTATGWASERGHWGFAGDDGVFHEVVCDLFHAEMGSVNLGPDCYSGILDGTTYHHIEAKCHGARVGTSLVDEVIEKYGGRSVMSRALRASVRARSILR